MTHEHSIPPTHSARRMNVGQAASQIRMVTSLQIEWSRDQRGTGDARAVGASCRILCSSADLVEEFPSRLTFDSAVTLTNGVACRIESVPGASGSPRGRPLPLQTADSVRSDCASDAPHTATTYACTIEWRAVQLARRDGSQPQHDRPPLSVELLSLQCSDVRQVRESGSAKNESRTAEVCAEMQHPSRLSSMVDGSAVDGGRERQTESGRVACPVLRRLDCHSMADGAPLFVHPPSQPLLSSLLPPRRQQAMRNNKQRATGCGESTGRRRPSDDANSPASAASGPAGHRQPPPQQRRHSLPSPLVNLELTQLQLEPRRATGLESVSSARTTGGEGWRLRLSRGLRLSSHGDRVSARVRSLVLQTPSRLSVCSPY